MNKKILLGLLIISGSILAIKSVCKIINNVKSMENKQTQYISKGYYKNKTIPKHLQN